jgi:hypothetical protein
MVTHTIVLSTDGTNHYLALVRIRDSSGELVQGVHLKWLGKSLELVNNWALEFTNVPTLEVVKLNDEWRTSLQVHEGYNSIMEIRN